MYGRGLLSGWTATAVVGLLVVGTSGCGPSKSAKSWSAFHQCLIGEPLAEGENVFFRIREVELGERTRPEPAERWPDRCIGHARELFTSIDGSGKTALLKRLLREQLNCTDEDPNTCAFPKDTQPLVKADETWNAVKLAELELGPAPDVQPPRRRLKPQVGKVLDPLASSKQGLLGSRALPSGELVLAYRALPGKPHRVCRVAASGATAKCTDLKQAAPSFTAAWLAGPGEPLALAGTERGDDGGEHPVAYLLPEGARKKLRSDRVAGFAVEARGDAYYLLSIKDGEVAAQSELDLEPEQHPGVSADWLGWFDVEKTKAEGEPVERRVMRWQQIGPDAKLAGEPTTLDGEIPARVDLCEFEGGAALYGWTDDRLVVWFRSPTGWSKQVGAAAASFLSQWGPECADGRLVWSSATPGALTVQTRICTAAGCQDTKGALDAEPPVWRRVAVLGEKTLALYEAKTQDLRLAVAPLSALGKASPIVVADSFEYSGPKLENLRVVLAKGFALLHFDDEESHHAITLKPDGTVAAVAVR